MGFFLLSKARLASRLARKTKDRDHWATAAALWERVAHGLPRSARVWVQLGHALRQSGRSAEAERAYLQAISIRSGIPAAWTGLGIARENQGMRDAALNAYAQALKLDPGLEHVRSKLLHYGGRDHQPSTVHGQSTMADAIAGMDNSLKQALSWQRQFDLASAFPAQDYARFRRDFAIAPPPQWHSDAGVVHVQIAAQAVTPVQIRATLQSLFRQSYGQWVAQVVTTAAICEHPVASLGQVDPRIAFTASAPVPASANWIITLDAGTLLDPSALAWFLWTMTDTGCRAAYCDSDQVTMHWKDGAERSAPLLHPTYDPYWFADADCAPAVVMIAPSVADDTPLDNLERLRHAARQGGVAHIPRLLASQMVAPVAASDASDLVPAVASGRTIDVIIPTRDNPGLLRQCVASIREKAADPDRLTFHILKNRSELPETLRLLETLSRDRQINVIDFDEPFNWSRANNLAARQSQSDILLFLNDDTDMLTTGWDDLLASALEDPDLGIVGALLLYPNGSIQHAGIILGMDGGGPHHEARWQGGAVDGPARRWQRPHLSSAVTGAFMAMPRHVYDAVGGFDERDLAIAYNDVDMCLRVREAGRTILYDPRIRLIHHESVSRGVNLLPEMIEWDCGELATIYERWGEAFLRDPGYNPQFVTQGYPFDGYREPPMSDIISHIRHSAADRPWAVTRAEGGCNAKAEHSEGSAAS